jgi:hypothetical protein
MHVGHLLTFEGYLSIHDYVRSGQPRIEELPPFVASFNIHMFALLPALKSLEIKCSIPDWLCLFWNGVSQRRRKIEAPVRQFVLDSVKVSLKGNCVATTITVIGSGGRLQRHIMGEYM